MHIPTFIGMDGEERPIRHAGEFWDHYGANVHIPLPGDLLFFSRSGAYPTHIGIVRDEETYIHAPGTNETMVEIAPITFESIAINGLGRQLYVSNPIGFKTPTKIHNNPSYRYHQEVIDS